MLKKEIKYMGKDCVIFCDGVCSKAWGLNTRPNVLIGDSRLFFSDLELGDAPKNPGTQEGADFKPLTDAEKLNKWCVRECERCSIRDKGVNSAIVSLRDFSKRFK